MKKLRQQVKVMAVQPASKVEKKTSSDGNQASGKFTRSKVTGSSKSSEDYFCYRCGGDGHIASKCKAPVNEKKVIQKLIQSLRKARGKQKNEEAPEEEHNCSVKRSAVQVKPTISIPEGLVGPSSVIPVKVNGTPCQALLDSGSVVTIIFEEWYNQYLADTPIHPISGLAVWGLSDSSFPYRGYVEVQLQFPEKLTGVQQSISVLALVCPEPQGPKQVPLLIGTNASMFQRLAQLCKESAGVDIVRTMPVNLPKSKTSKMEAGEPRNAEDAVAEIHWSGPGPLSIPPRSECQATCKVKVMQSIDKSILVVDQPSTSSSPAEVLVKPTIIPSSAIQMNRFPVILRNVSQKEVCIPVGAVVAHGYTTEVATTVEKEHSARGSPVDPCLFNFGDSPIPKYWKDRLSQKLSERTNVFSLHEWDVGCAKGVEHHIRLSDSTPFRERSRRLAPADIDDIRRHLHELLAAGVIKESRSAYASPIVVARKKNGTVRMCIDYRTLNTRTIPDQYTVPRIDEALDCLTGSRWFSVLDLRSGYYQIQMADEDKDKTAFICPLGFYQFERMPQGISGAPATFQRLMEKAVGDMNLLEVLVYLDDLIVFGKTLEEHEERLLKVLDRLEESGLKVSFDKCQFCQPQVKYVGHIISEKGIATDPAKVEAVTNWKQPTDLKSLRSFLGFCGYYRRFIANYSAIVRPLTELTKGYPPTQHGKKAVKNKGMYYKESEAFGGRWTEECTEAFKKIIHCLTNAPVLAFADSTKPYILHVDASLNGLGAVLNQEYPEGLRPVAFASRKLKVSEQRYPVHQLEFLALKWAVVDKFHDYLYGARFTVRTDNNPLTYILTTAKLNAAGHRWLAALSTYNFNIQYKPGKNNIDADALSRNFSSTAEEQDWQEISPSGIQALCKTTNTQKCVEQLGVSPEVIPECYAFPTRLDVGSLEHLSSHDLIKAQEEDPAISPVIHAVKKGQLFSLSRDKDPEVHLLQKEGSKLVVRKGLLFRVVQRQQQEECRQLVLPQKYRTMVLQSLHDETGHLGVDKTTALIKDRFYWPKMSNEIDQYVKNCGKCILRKTQPQRAAPLNQITSNGPMDLVCIDFLSLKPDSKGVFNILVVTDHYTRYAQAFPTKDQKALTVAKVLCERYFVHYGLPARIHSDQGRDFESKLIHELLKMLGIQKSRTTPYHPQGDPQPERFNRTLLSMLGTLDKSQKQKWSRHVSQLVHAYNCTRNDATGYSPYVLMFGREARLPIDLCFSVSSEGEAENYQQYVSKLRSDLKRAYQVASDAADKSHQKNKRLHDKRVRDQILEEGDRVLIRNLGVAGKNKLGNKWSSLPYVVVSKMPNLPVYHVKPEKGKGIVKTLHRNHLLPIGYLVRMPKEIEEKKVSQRPATRSQTLRQTSLHEAGTADVLVEGSYEEDELYSDCEDVDAYIPLETMEELRRLPESPNLRSVLQERRVSVPVESESKSDNSEGNVIHFVEDSEPKRMGDTLERERHDDDTTQEVERPNTPVVEGNHLPFPEEPDGENNPNGLEPAREIRSKREIKPVVKLSYDELGKSTNRPIYTITRGMPVHCSFVAEGRRSNCNTVWCHPLATCHKCSRVPERKRIKHL